MGIFNISSLCNKQRNKKVNIDGFGEVRILWSVKTFVVTDTKMTMNKNTGYELILTGKEGYQPIGLLCCDCYMRQAEMATTFLWIMRGSSTWT